MEGEGGGIIMVAIVNKNKAAVTFLALNTI